MKKTQLKELSAASDDLANAKAKISAVKDELEDEFSSKSEKWQESDKGEEFQEVINALDDLYGEIESAEENLNGMIPLD